MTDDPRYNQHPESDMPSVGPGGEYLWAEPIPVQPRLRPHAKKRNRFGVHIVLFLATVATTLFAGALLADVNPFADLRLLSRGMPFSFALMSILLSHELGHYLMSRRHRVEATLPYFIPAPTIIGTFGAVIKMKSNVPDRRALLDIGAAGPIVGFVMSVPALVIGLRLSQVLPGEPTGMVFGSSLLLEVIARIVFPNVPTGHVIYLHPVALAGWLGLLVTMMNLLPVGMMDGGHIAYALFGKWHYHISRAMVGILVVMGIFGWRGWAVWGIVNLLFGLRHPPPVWPDVRLDPKRKLIGVVAALIFIVTFVPTPISIP
jgi:membrane-associated protease RseP (regulator of RpoE activity)